jgi:hypothetical protein
MISEFNLDILDAAIWQQESEGSLQVQSCDICFCEVKSMILLLRGANETAPDFRLNAKNVCIGHKEEFLAISTMSLEHTCSDPGIVSMFSGIRIIQNEYIKMDVANAYLLLSNFKVKCVQRALERLQNMFVPRKLPRQQSPVSSVSCQMLTSAEASAKLDSSVYACNTLSSENSGLAHEGMWYDQGITSEYSERYDSSAEFCWFFVVISTGYSFSQCFRFCGSGECIPVGLCWYKVRVAF